MIVFWILSLIVIVPAAWSMTRAMRESHIVEALLQTGILLCLISHFNVFWTEFYLGVEPSILVRRLNILATVLILPFMFMYSARRISALHLEDCLVMLITTPLAFIVSGQVNIGGGEIVPMKSEIMNVAICRNEEVLTTVKLQNLVVVLQTVYALFKIIVIHIRMYKKNYSYSRNFTHFINLSAFGLVLAVLSFVPDNSLWLGTYYSIAFVVLMFTIVGVGYVFLALKMDEAPIVDENEEPVLLNASEHFVALRDAFERLIEENIESLESATMDSIAKRLGTNRTYLAQMVKEHYGITFSQYLNEMRVKRAKTLLANRNEATKVQEVAWKSGFSSVSTFNKVFKSVTGVAPSEWNPEE